MGIQCPAMRNKESFHFLQNGKIGCRASSPFHNLLCSSRICRFSYRVQDSCESQPQYKMPAYSVVKDLCVRHGRTVPLLVERSLAFFSKGYETIKNPASSAGPSRPNATLDGFARCSTICYPEFVTDLSFGWYSETLDRP